MRCSVVTYKQINNMVDDFRLDADYYQPQYLEEDLKRTNFDTISIGEFSYVTDGQHGYHEVDDKSPIFHLTAKNAKGWFANTDGADRLAKWVDDKNKRSSLKERDIILSTRGTIGFCALVMNDVLPANIDQDVARIAVDISRGIEPEYLITYLNSDFGQHWLIRNSSGMVQQGIPLDKVRLVPIPKLSKDFQILCKQVVLRAFNVISKSKTSYLEAEKILLSELGILDWKPKHQLSFAKSFSSTEVANRIDAEYFQPIYDDLSRNIKGYKNGYKVLNDLVYIRKCIEPGSEFYLESGIPFLRVSNLSKYGINSDNQKYLSESLYERLKDHQPQKGEILLSKDATPGIAYYLNKEPQKMIPSSGIVRLNIKDNTNINPEYLTLVLNSVVVQKQIEREIGGSVIDHWLVDQVNKTLIPILPKASQNDISDKIKDSFIQQERSGKLLNIAKRGVEIAIKHNEDEAINWINQEVINYA